MKRQLTKLLTVMLCVLSLAALCFGMAACGAKSYEVTLDYNGEQGSVTLSPTAEGNKYEEGSKVTVTVTAKDGYEIDTFTVSTDANAKLADGKYELTVSADTTVKATFKTAAIAVTGITLTPDTLALEVGGTTESATATLVAEVAPADATDKTVTWTSSDPTVATVEGGNVTALAAGETTITATAGGKSATCVVTVTQHVHTAKDATYLQDTENNKHYQLCECGERVNEAEHAAAEDAEWKQDAENNQHYKECVCGEHVEVAAHTAKDATYQQDTENNKHYQLCECGARVNEAEHAAAEGAEWKQDAENNQHYKECVCGEHVEVAAHTAKDATYQQDTENNKHYQLCECGARVNEAEHAAAEGAEWKQDTENNQHYKECVCGEHVEAAAHQKGEETISDGNEGHHYECECGYAFSQEKHQNASGEYTNESAARHSYMCDVCDETVWEDHVYDSPADPTESFHGNTKCVCGRVKMGYQHSFETVPDPENPGKHHDVCSAEECGYVKKDSSKECSMTWTMLEDAASGHSGVCSVCNYKVEKEDHDLSSRICKCGYYAGYGSHTHEDKPDANGFYDGVCDTDNAQLDEPVWEFENGVIKKYNGSYAKVRIPESIGGVSVTELSSKLFASQTNLTDVIVPDCVIKIGSQLFSKASALKTVVFGTGIQALATGTFQECAQLESVLIKATEFSFGSSIWGTSGKVPTSMKIFFNLSASKLREIIDSITNSTGKKYAETYLTQYYCYQDDPSADDNLQQFGGAWHYDDAGVQIGDVKIAILSSEPTSIEQY